MEQFNVQYYAMFDDIAYYPRGSSRYELICDTMMPNIKTYISIKGFKTLLTSPLTGGSVISMPKKWGRKDIKDAFKLNIFLVNRFIYIIYRAKIVPLLMFNQLSPYDKATHYLVADAMEKAAISYNEKVKLNKHVKRDTL